MGVLLPRPKPRQKKGIVWVISLLAIAALVGLSRAPEFTSAEKPDADERPVAQPMHRSQPDPIRDPAAAAAYLDKIALQSHGDIRCLSPADQTFLSGMSARYGATMLRGRYQHLQAERHASEPTPRPKT